MEISEFVGPRLRPWLVFAAQLTRDEPLAEDIVQDVIVNLHRNWDRIRVLDAPDAYVYRMLTNEFLSWKRKWGRVVPMRDVPRPGRADDHAADTAQRDALDTAMRTLPRRQRAALVLRYLCDYSDADIAAVLGCSEGTVRSHVSRGLAGLRVEPAAGLIRAERDSR